MIEFKKCATLSMGKYVENEHPEGEYSLGISSIFKISGAQNKRLRMGSEYQLEAEKEVLEMLENGIKTLQSMLPVVKHNIAILEGSTEPMFKTIFKYDKAELLPEKPKHAF